MKWRIYVCVIFFFLVDFRTSGGRLHLIQDVGKIPLADATLIEEPNDSDKEDESMNKNNKYFSNYISIYMEMKTQFTQITLPIHSRSRCTVTA